MPIACQYQLTCYKGFIVLVAIILAAYGCASGPSIVGNWQALEGDARVTFSDAGVFDAVDNEGMAVSGKYHLIGTDGIRFEVLHGGHETEVIDARMIRDGDGLTLIFSGNDAAETYRRIP